MQCLKLSNTKKALSVRSLTTAWKVLCERLVLSNRKPSMLLLKLLCELRIQGRWPGIWVLVLTALLAVWLWAVYLSIPFHTCFKVYYWCVLCAGACAAGPYRGLDIFPHGFWVGPGHSCFPSKAFTYEPPCLSSISAFLIYRNDPYHRKYLKQCVLILLLCISKNCKTQFVFSCRSVVSFGSYLVSVHCVWNYKEGRKKQGKDPEECEFDIIVFSWSMMHIAFF